LSGANAGEVFHRLSWTTEEKEGGLLLALGKWRREVTFMSHCKTGLGQGLRTASDWGKTISKEREASNRELHAGLGRWHRPSKEGSYSLGLQEWVHQGDENSHPGLVRVTKVTWEVAGLFRNTENGTSGREKRTLAVGGRKGKGGRRGLGPRSVLKVCEYFVGNRTGWEGETSVSGQRERMGSVKSREDFPAAFLGKTSGSRWRNLWPKLN